MSGPSEFRLDDVVAGPDAEPILRGVTARIECAGVTAVAGRSGAGKTTLLRLLDRLDDPRAGTVSWKGRPLTDWSPTELRRRVAMVFQRPPIFAGTVLDNLRVARSSLDEVDARAALDRVGLPGDLVDRTASDLSGGEAQRMAFARALLTEPEVVLADEPTASLDGAARGQVEAVMAALAADGIAVILVSHDTGQLRRLADRAIVLDSGRAVASGAVRELDHHPDPIVRAAVGGGEEPS